MARRAARRKDPAPGGAVTLRDVARAAGTTPMSVSNVVNARQGQVGDILRARVLAACERLGYRPHASARRLRTNRHMTVGVIIVDPSPHYLSDPFTAALLAGLNDVFGAAGYSIALHGATADGLGSLPVVRRIASDGIVLVLSGPPAGRRAILDRVAALGQPVALVQDEWPGDDGDGASFIQDDTGGGATLARHLFEQPARHVAMLVPDVSWPAMERREAGVRGEIARLRRRPAFHVVRCGDESFEATQAAFSTHVDRHGAPDVVIGGNDRMAIAAMKWLVARGGRVPQDARVTGFNGFDFWRYATPELTTVRSPAFRLGEEAARALLARLKTGRFPARRTVLPVEFAPHRSSMPAADDPKVVRLQRRERRG